jgi:methylated-DNA-[protein]-cysteine S-methyltransferase
MRLLLDEIRSPVGPLLLGVDPESERVCALDFADTRDRMESLLARRSGGERVSWVDAKDPGGHSSRIESYLAGELGVLDEIPVDPGGTAFQQLVWAELRQIPAGSTWSYGELACRLGRPAAVRAVGAANGQNPIALILPCHRVIGADGSLRGYAGGLRRKSWLLAHEASA